MHSSVTFRTCRQEKQKTKVNVFVMAKTYASSTQQKIVYGYIRQNYAEKRNEQWMTWIILGFYAYWEHLVRTRSGKIRVWKPQLQHFVYRGSLALGSLSSEILSIHWHLKLNVQSTIFNDEGDLLIGFANESLTIKYGIRIVARSWDKYHYVTSTDSGKMGKVEYALEGNVNSLIISYSPETRKIAYQIKDHTYLNRSIKTVDLSLRLAASYFATCQYPDRIVSCTFKIHRKS